ncbi:MAG TPA: M4 family metallopeptidase, partial [Chthoniobacterales bacterium]
MNSEGITAVNGNYIPGVALNTTPAVSSDVAGETALATLRKGASDAAVSVRSSELAIYPAGLAEGRAVVSRLAYAVEVAGGKAPEQVWVDAHNGAVLARIPLHHSVLNRRIYSPDYDPENPELFLQRKEGDAPHPTPFVNNLYDFAGQTYNFYASAFGRDSYDAAGHTMISVYLINQQCPNAYWNGESTNYCPAFDADDVVSHEWSHAYTQFTHGLIYAYQSGALNESYSDIFGEAVDLLNGADGIGGTNNSKPFPEGQRWLVGEDLGEEAQQLLLRDMYDPDRLSDPGKVSSPNYACGNSDGGGVHTNSGVPNHAFALIVDGTQYKPAAPEINQAAGTYNGQTVTGIGLTKASAIYYRAESVYQTPSTFFAQHDTAVQQSCTDLIGVGLKDPTTTSATGANSSAVITANDCQQVAKAMLAVEMSMTPPCNFGPVLSAAPAPLCAGVTPFFSEDWETGEDGWTKTSMGFATGLVDWEQQPSKNNTRFFKLTTNLPGGRTGTAAFAPDPKVGQEGGGTCMPGGDYSGSHTLDSPQITIPAGASAPLLVFDHYIAAEAGVDGGQVEISTDNGMNWTLVPKSAYVFNAPNNVYNEAAPVGNNTGPNPSEEAWSGFNVGVATLGNWGTTVANLSGLVQPGGTVRIRFTWSQDGCNGVEGWYVDNIKLVTCPVLQAPVLSVGSDYENPDTNGSFTLNWVRPNGAAGPDLLQESQTSCGPIIFDNAEMGLTKWTTTTSGTGAQPWKTDNTKPNHPSNTFNVQGVNGVTNAESYLTYNDPIAIPSGGQT